MTAQTRAEEKKMDGKELEEKRCHSKLNKSR